MRAILPRTFLRVNRYEPGWAVRTPTDQAGSYIPYLEGQLGALTAA